MISENYSALCNYYDFSSCRYTAHSELDLYIFFITDDLADFDIRTGSEREDLTTNQLCYHNDGVMQQGTTETFYCIQPLVPSLYVSIHLVMYLILRYRGFHKRKTLAIMALMHGINFVPPYIFAVFFFYMHKIGVANSIQWILELCILKLQSSLILFISNDRAKTKLAICHSCIVQSL